MIIWYTLHCITTISSLQQITQLLQDVSAKRDELLPKKKFAFKSRKREDHSAPSKPTEEAVQTRIPKPVTSVVNEKMVGFCDRRNEKLTLNVSGCSLYIVGHVITWTLLCV